MLRRANWAVVLALLQIVPWMLVVIFALVRLPNVLNEIPEAAQDTVSHALRSVVCLAGIAFVVSVGAFVCLRSWRRKCGDPYLDPPRPDLAAALGVVEQKAQAAHWCRRREQCERAGLECSLIAAAELARLLEIIENRLSKFHQEWEAREMEKGTPEAGKSFLAMAESAEDFMRTSQWRSTEMRRICAIVYGLRDHWTQAEEILTDFRQRVVNALQGPEGSQLKGQERATKAADDLLCRTKAVSSALTEWRDGAQTALQCCQEAVTQVDR